MEISYLSSLPPSRWPRASERKSWQHLLKPLLEGHRYHPETEKYHQTSSHRRARRCQRWRFVGAETTPIHERCLLGGAQRFVRGREQARQCARVQAWSDAPLTRPVELTR